MRSGLCPLWVTALVSRGVKAVDEFGTTFTIESGIWGRSCVARRQRWTRLGGVCSSYSYVETTGICGIEWEGREGGNLNQVLGSEDVEGAKGRDSSSPAYACARRLVPMGVGCTGVGAGRLEMYILGQLFVESASGWYETLECNAVIGQHLVSNDLRPTGVDFRQI